MTIDGDALLKIWAVIGPLLAAGASAVWSRRNQVQDRSYESTREIEQRTHTTSERVVEHRRALQAENYKELKTALANFMVSANDFISRQCEWLTTPNADTKAASLAAIEKFNYHCQLVTLLGQPATADLAIEVWNTAFTAAKSYDAPMDATHQKAVDAYRSVKLKFLTHARDELASRKEA